MKEIDVNHTKYDYFGAVVADITHYLAENEIVLRDTNLECLEHDLYMSDEVTGNASGSYTFNAWRAEIYLCHNLDLLEDALDEFGYDLRTANIMSPEWCDVLIRCYLVPSALEHVVDEFTDMLEQYHLDR